MTIGNEENKKYKSKDVELTGNFCSVYHIQTQKMSDNGH